MLPSIASVLVLVTADVSAARAVASMRIETRPSGPLVPPASGPHPGHRGSTILVDSHGLLVVERTTGTIVRCRRDGGPVARLELHPDLGEIVGDGRGHAFIADRRGGRVVKLTPGDDDGDGLAVAAEVEVVEPYGLALTMDGGTLAVTSIGEQSLVFVDTTTMTRARTLGLGAPEPRGVAIAGDPSTVHISFLTTGAIVNFPMSGLQMPRWHSLSSGDAEARGAWAIGAIGHHRVVVPHHRATPRSPRTSASSLTHHLTRLHLPGTARTELLSAQIDLHQPRAIAYDPGRDTLYIGGYGDDRVLAVADISQQAPRVAWSTALAQDLRDACGIDGLALDRNTLWVHCELARRLMAIDLATADPTAATAWRRGPELAPDGRSPLVARGAELFRRGRDPRLSAAGAMACASCHPEGRADGLTWLIGQVPVQTPMLNDRLLFTAPYGWFGQYADLDAAVSGLIIAQGGRPSELAADERSALRAYMESLPRPVQRTKDVGEDLGAIHNGRMIFEKSCLGCHAGERSTDGRQRAYHGAPAPVDTPSLIGVPHSAPYFHDGSAPTLEDAARDLGGVHGRMGVDYYSHPDRPWNSDILAYLRSL